MYFRNVRKTIGRIILSNIFQTSQQHCCTTAGMLRVSKVVASTSQQSLILRCVRLYLEYKQTVLQRREFVCMLRIKQCTLHLMIFLFTFSKESPTLPQNVFKNVCNKTGSCTASALMSGDVLAMKQYMTYIRIPQTLQNPINVKFQKTFNQLSLLRSQAEENSCNS